MTFSAAGLVLALFVQATGTGPPVTEAPVVVVGEPVTVAAARPTPTPSPTPLPKRPKPEVRVSCTPRLSISGGIVPSVITATVRVVNPDERLWCPRVEWYAGEEFQGSHESDCNPYEALVRPDGGGPERWSDDEPRRISLGPGLYTIRAKLTKGGKTVGEGECKVEVH